MRALKRAVLFATFLGTAALLGCGSNLGSGGDQTGGETGFGTDAAGRAYVGSGNCVGCHRDLSRSSQLVAAYLEGKHVIHSDHISAASDAACLDCHDPTRSGSTLESLVDPAHVPAGGLAAVGCEDCHGAGGEHYGVGPMPSPRPDHTACGGCHTALPEGHLRYHPEGNEIAAAFQDSAHARSGDRNELVCVKCHTDEGGRRYREIDNVERLETVVLPLETSSPIQCRTCHDPHDPSKLLEEATTDRSGAVTASAQYNTCANCHQRHDAKVGTTRRPLAGSTSSDGASADGDLIYHAARWNRVITTTHYDDPKTTKKIEGYTMSPKNEHVCLDCHNVHAADTTINRQWARSAHGGFLLKAKEFAVSSDNKDPAKPASRTIDEVNYVKAAGSIDDGRSPFGAPGWARYDWDAQNRRSCQRCHTATGAKNFMTDPAGYDPANNDFSHLVGWKIEDGTVTSSGQNEMLYCWGCHSNNSGALRNPGAITEEYDPAVVVSYPDISGSNVCMTCHLGRETGEVIKVDADDDGKRGFINSHYLAAGGDLFGETGYEYAGRNYQDVTFFTHDRIGTESLPGRNGPCVSCHMMTEEAHLFRVVEKDETTGAITAITSTVCVECHDGSVGPAFVVKGGDPAAVTAAADALTAEAEEYEAALEALKAALANKGIHFGEAHPYFFTAPHVPGGSNTAFQDWASVYGFDKWKDTMGAAFNANLLIHDPGGYAHNRFYAKALIWDSIDFIDNGSLDASVVATIKALETAGKLSAAHSEGAQAYLGTSRPGDASRPPLQ